MYAWTYIYIYIWIYECLLCEIAMLCVFFHLLVNLQFPLIDCMPSLTPEAFWGISHQMVKIGDIASTQNHLSEEDTSSRSLFMWPNCQNQVPNPSRVNLRKNSNMEVSEGKVFLVWKMNWWDFFKRIQGPSWSLDMGKRAEVNPLSLSEFISSVKWTSSSWGK